MENTAQKQGIEFEQVLQLFSWTLSNQDLVNPDGEAVLSVVSDYARSWSLLQGYYEQGGSFAVFCYQESSFNRWQ